MSDALFAPEAIEAGKRQNLERENRLLRACIERQQAQLVAMDAKLEGAWPELVLVRELAKGVKTIRAALEPYNDAWRATRLMRADDAEALHRVACDWLVKVAHLDIGAPCTEPGCVLREPVHRYVSHTHTDGFRQWRTVQTGKGLRRFKRGAW